MAAPPAGLVKADLRRPSPFIVQQGEECPFRVELGGRTEPGQHLARDAVDTHAGPLRALAIARISDLPKSPIQDFLKDYRAFAT
jgi:hypothetical protein